MIHVLVIFLFGFNAVAAEPAMQQLSSMDEFKEKFARWNPTETADGVEYFVGAPVGMRKGLNQKYEALAPKHKKAVWKLDKKKLLVTPLVSEEQYEKLFAADTVLGDLTLDPTGRILSAFGSCIIPEDKLPDNGYHTKIVFIKTDTGEVTDLINDGRFNFAPSFSPDGRYLAYYSSDPHFGQDSNAFYDQNGGYVINLSTREIKKLVEPYRVKETQWLRMGPPAWLDKDRVLFSTSTSDRSLVTETMGALSGDCLYYVAVVNVGTWKVNKLFFPTIFYIDWVIDREKERLILYNRSQIVQTGYDLSQPKVLAVAKEKQMVSHAWLENGELKYTIR